MTSKIDLLLLGKSIAPDFQAKKETHFEKIANSFLNSWLFRRLICMDESVYEDLVYDAVIRDEVDDQMEIVTTSVESDALSVAAIAQQLETGEKLLGLTEVDQDFYKPLRNVAKRLSETDGDLFHEIKAECGLTDDEVLHLLRIHRYYHPTAASQAVTISPKFIATAVQVLRGKLGRLPVTDANRIVVDTEYNRVCRNGSVRLWVQDHHRQYVMNAFFGKIRSERVALSRSRAPAWVRRTLGYENPRVNALVC